MPQINKPNTYFNTKLHTGTGAEATITGIGFQPDLVWSKSRSNAESNTLIDGVRGAGNALTTDTTSAEATGETQMLKSFNSDGFVVGFNGQWNASAYTYVYWNWLAGGSASSNTDGSITSSVSANTTSGFSIVSWTGNSGTVGHGLGVKPACIIVKSRQSVNNWVVIHQGLGTMSGNVLVLNSTGAASGGGAGQAEPTADVFTITSGLAANDNNIGYVFAEKKGFSKFGSYTGNGSADGTFIYTGFKPAMVILKDYTSGSGYNWVILDNKRDPSNSLDRRLQPSSAFAEYTDISDFCDFTSNGFKWRGSQANWNGSGVGYIYMAFAENPLVGTNNIPATAR